MLANVVRSVLHCRDRLRSASIYAKWILSTARLTGSPPRTSPIAPSALNSNSRGAEQYVQGHRTERLQQARPHGRVLIICTHFRRDRSKRRSRDPLQPLNGLHIAALIDEQRFQIDLHHEDWHGPYDVKCVKQYDLVFLSGLQADFDRMRQLSYHFRRTGAKVVAGGNLCSMFPEFCSHFFDAICIGGVEGVSQIVSDYERGRLKPIYRSPKEGIAQYRCNYGLFTRYGINLPFHLVEASRGCSFRCKFCVIPAEGLHHASYDLSVVERMIDDSIAASPWLSFRRWYPIVWFVDNNFSDDRQQLMKLCDMLRAKPKLRAWGALVTQNILRDRELLRYMAGSRCRALFSGIESLDPEFLRRQNKRQNISRRNSVIDDVMFAEQLGICVTYAYLFDPRHSDVADMKRQIETLVRCTGFPLPAFFSVIVPLVGTVTFWESVAAGELLPQLRLRDLDGETVCYARLVDKTDVVSAFIRTLSTNPGRFVQRRQLWKTIVRRVWNARSLNPIHWYILLKSSLRTFSYAGAYDTDVPRRYLGGIDALDPQYYEQGDDISPEDWERYFKPIFVTDKEGKVAAWLEQYAPASVGQALVWASRNSAEDAGSHTSHS